PSNRVLPMPERPDVVARLIPEPVRSEAFLPARMDLRVESRNTVSYLLRLAALITQCWWLVARAPRSHPRPSRGVLMGHFVSSLTHATRLLYRQPGLALAVVLTLTLGIGANTAVFSVVEAVLLRALPYPTADRLVMLEHRDERTGLTKPN